VFRGKLKALFTLPRRCGLQPGTVAEFEARFAKRYPLREKHSKLGAFWHTAIEALNQVIHVWPYEGLQYRAAVRDAAAKGSALQQLPGAGGLASASDIPSRGPLALRDHRPWPRMPCRRRRPPTSV
jgi:NIPSNAP